MLGNGLGSACEGVRARQLWLAGLAAPQHVGSSWTSDQTHVTCIGRLILDL